MNTIWCHAKTFFFFRKSSLLNDDKWERGLFDRSFIVLQKIIIKKKRNLSMKIKVQQASNQAIENLRFYRNVISIIAAWKKIISPYLIKKNVKLYWWNRSSFSFWKLNVIELSVRIRDRFNIRFVNAKWIIFAIAYNFCCSLLLHDLHFDVSVSLNVIFQFNCSNIFLFFFCVSLFLRQFTCLNNLTMI